MSITRRGTRRTNVHVENALIREKYPTGDLVELAAELGCSVGAVCQRAARIEVYRTVIASRAPKAISFGTHRNKQVTFVAPGHMIHKAT
jgi:hypothetical protein